MRICLTFAAVLQSVLALAMPTRSELEVALPQAGKMMLDNFRAVKDGKMSAVDAAVDAERLANGTKDEAQRFLLFKGAFGLYVQGESYAAALGALDRLTATVKDIPGQVLMDIIDAKLKGLSNEKGCALRERRACIVQRLRVEKERAVADREHVRLETERTLADRLEKENRRLKSELATAMAKLAAKKTVEESKPVEKRKIHRVLKQDKPIAFDLGDGVTMVFESCPTGTFVMGSVGGKYRLQYSSHKVNITRPFWMAKLQITKEQWLRIAKFQPSVFRSGRFGAQDLSVDSPKSVMVGAFTHKEVLGVCADLTTRFRNLVPEGYVVRPPTEAEWEYAFKLGLSVDEKTISWLDGKKLERYGHGVRRQWEFFHKSENTTDLSPSAYQKFALVGLDCGQYEPDALGLYDMFGNIKEMTLDIVNDTILSHLNAGDQSIKNWYGEDGADPLKWGYDDERPKDFKNTDFASFPILRGGDGWPVFRDGQWRYHMEYKTTAAKAIKEKWNFGLRLSIGPELLTERGLHIPEAEAIKAETIKTEPEKPSAAIKPIKNEGDPIVLNLDKNVRMEFVPCPAGEFTMGYVDKEGADRFYLSQHKVRISRPFWMAKLPVTKEQWALFGKAKPQGSSRNWYRVDPTVVGGPKAAVVGIWDLADVLKSCDVLNKKFKRLLPRGCVVRPPTEAEWEYALKCGGSDPQFMRDGCKGLAELDAFERFAPGRKSHLEAMRRMLKKPESANNPPGYRCDFTGFDCGMHQPNAWGIHDQIGNLFELTLDSVDAKVFAECMKQRLKASSFKGEWWYSDAVDPLKWEYPNSKEMSKDKVISPLLRGGCGWMPSGEYAVFTHKLTVERFLSVDRFFAIRLVIAPDLMKERGLLLPKD